MWIRSDGSEAFILAGIVLGCYLLHLVSLHASSLISFPPLAPPAWTSLQRLPYLPFQIYSVGTAKALLISHLD